MKKLLIVLSLFVVIGGGYYLFQKDDINNQGQSGENINPSQSNNTGSGESGEKFTSKMLGWLGIAHVGDPTKPETWDVINGIKVPSMPDEKENNKTIGGIDINNNGVRDDVERLAAEKFGADKELFPKLMEHNKTQRSAMMTLNADDVVAHKNYVNCVQQMDFTKSLSERALQLKTNEEIVKKINVLTYAQANTNERGKAYAKAMLIRDSRVKDCNIGE